MIFILAFIGFAILHSILANEYLKKRLFEKYPSLRYYYRAFYNTIALITFGLIWFFVPVEHIEIYSIQSPYHYFFHFFQLIGFIGLLFSVRFMSGSFSGVKQLNDAFKQQKPIYFLDEPGYEKLYTGGPFGYIRHPLYSFSMLVLFFHPYMTLKWLLFSICCLTYFVIGSKLEEKKLLLRYEQAYQTYRDKVPAFIPSFSALYKRVLK